MIRINSAIDLHVIAVHTQHEFIAIHITARVIGLHDVTECIRILYIDNDSINFYTIIPIVRANDRDLNFVIYHRSINPDRIGAGVFETEICLAIADVSIPSDFNKADGIDMILMLYNLQLSFQDGVVQNAGNMADTNAQNRKLCSANISHGFLVTSLGG